ncbi:MAG: hypothetical protein R3C56_12955 [Pirellulaceae bacterium]
MIVFNAQGRIAYWDKAVGVPIVRGPLPQRPFCTCWSVELSKSRCPTHPRSPPKMTPTIVNANVNDNANSWLTIKVFTGSITSAGMQAGSEGAHTAVRLPVSRRFATYGITQSEN